MKDRYQCNHILPLLLGLVFSKDISCSLPTLVRVKIMPLICSESLKLPFVLYRVHDDADETYECTSKHCFLFERHYGRKSKLRGLSDCKTSRSSINKNRIVRWHADTNTLWGFGDVNSNPSCTARHLEGTVYSACLGFLVFHFSANHCHAKWNTMRILSTSAWFLVYVLLVW